MNTSKASSTLPFKDNESKHPSKMDVKTFINELNELRKMMEKNDPHRFEESEERVLAK